MVLTILIYTCMYLVIMIMMNFEDDTNMSLLDLKCPELELELKLIVSCGNEIGIGIEKNGIGTGIELKKWNWPQPS